MSKRSIKLWLVLFLICISFLSVSACGTEEDTDSTFSDKMVNLVMENSEVVSVLKEENIVVDKIFYGTFSKEGAREIFVTCKLLDMPHVGGLDRTAVILLNADTLDLVTYREFGADRLEISCFRTNSGYSRILVLGTSTYQGISTQQIGLFAIRGDEWEELSMDVLETIPMEPRDSLGSEYFCFASENGLIVSYEYELTEPEEIIAILFWDSDMEQFVMRNQEQ